MLKGHAADFTDEIQRRVKEEMAGDILMCLGPEVKVSFICPVNNLR